MRNSFVKAIEDFVKPELILITGDLGFGVLSNFQKKYPDQFINAGVAEQNMTGIAAGLALEGKKVFTYSIANFNTLRALEQIRNDIAYHDLNVTIVSVGGGMAYGQLGISHHATEDLAIMRAIPNMKVFAPGDTIEAYEITKYIINNDIGPSYLRLGRAGEITLHEKNSFQFQIGKATLVLSNGNKDLAILSTGGMLEVANEIFLEFKKKIGVSLYSFHTIKPIDEELVIDIFKNFKNIISLEEHSITGGFSSSILECLPGIADINLKNYYPFALPSAFTYIVGDQKYLRDYYGLSTKKILNRLNKLLIF